ncbi:hypothetical protein [Thermoleptolyngbya sp.]
MGEVSKKSSDRPSASGVEMRAGSKAITHRACRTNCRTAIKYISASLRRRNLATAIVWQLGSKR